MDLQNKTVLVIGTGKSGIGAAGLLSKAGAKTILFDSNEKLNVEALKEKTAGIASLQLVTGTLPLELEEQVELLVVSPGVPIDSNMVVSFEKRGIPVWGEIELVQTVCFCCGKHWKSLYRYCDGHERGFCGGCGDQQLPVRDHPYLCTEGIRDPEYYTGSFKPSPHHGVLCGDEGEDCIKPDEGGCLCTQL